MRIKGFFFSYFFLKNIRIEKLAANYYYFFYKTCGNFIWKLGERERERESKLLGKKAILFLLKYRSF